MRQVHGAMAGFTSFLVGPVNGRHVYVPLHLVANRKNQIAVASGESTNLWARTVFATDQPTFALQQLGGDGGCDVDASFDFTTATGGCVATDLELGSA